MTLQQWLFSFKGRTGRRDFWVWIGLWVSAMTLLFVLADKAILEIRSAAFMLVCLLWPTAAVVVKRLHDRGRSALWALSVILAWMLFAGNWVMLDGIWKWAVGVLLPTIIMAGMVIELGILNGTPGGNKYGQQTGKVKYR